ncbi:MAG: serine dehydratase subunit alpha family protein, partial [Firmicutes bacterium]|nr:serine dehydratase subunit alpha family protein [Bacillota bacterium]
MDKRCKTYETYVQVLRDELVPAMGCTEPIAVAFCAAKAKDALGEMPDRIDIKVSGNIIKNVKSVVVPNTDGMVGMEAAAAAGIVFGKSEKDLEVIAEVTPEQKDELRRFLKEKEFHVSPTYGTEVLEIIITLEKNGHTSRARVIKSHAHLETLEKDGQLLYQAEPTFAEVKAADKSLLNIKDIYDFAKTCDLEDIREVISYQIKCNSAISEEGLKNDWGARNGKTVMKNMGSDLRFKAAAAAAAGSDARMSGCELPVVIISG